MSNLTSLPRKTTRQRSVALPIASGRRLTIRATLVETLQIERRLLPEDSKKASAALELAWKAMSEEIAAGDVNLIAWLDDALNEAHGANLWIASIFLKRLRQLQRSELTAIDDNGIAFEVPKHHGLPEHFLACAFFMGWQTRIVRRIGTGFEHTNGDEATEWVNAASHAWRTRPGSGSEYEIRVHIESELAAAGLRVI